MKITLPKIARLALAAALTLPAAALAADETKVVSRIEPEFPHVHARATTDGGGEVTHVEIVDATPRRVFDRAVTRALVQWHFNPGSSGRLYEVNIDFQR